MLAHPLFSILPKGSYTPMPANERTLVLCREETIHFPTYRAMPADPNPIFLEKRVYQGSSGRVYPNPFTEKIASSAKPQAYRAIFLENEYIELMLLPEIGGRIHTGTDKTSGYDFFYRQRVIKPALVGLLGPWISGGVEFNWPQHHRPSTFMPTHAAIERPADGGCTVWMSEHDPMQRMKGMVGIHLAPGSSVVEARVRLFNRTPLPQTFLWWANVAVRVHEDYEVFFPPDVTAVADHAKRAISSFPIAHDTYYGVDYSPGTDLRWYKNIPVPTSYMVPASSFDFFGGYDHRAQAGIVHVSDHHIAPGKKLWTWGSGEFGQAWDRNLTDDDGPYVELMAGAYTDNQPDFSWLQPYETRCFSQFWYPIQQIGPAHCANLHAAISLTPVQSGLRLGVATTQPRSLLVTLNEGDHTLASFHARVEPDQPLLRVIYSTRTAVEGLRVTLLDDTGALLLSHSFRPVANEALPEPAREPSPPEAMSTVEELYLTGLHIEQYRHATRSAEAYWQEGLRRDPGDARIHNAMGLAALRRGLFAEAEEHLRAAIRRLTHLNPNPRDGEPFYNLGLALRFQHRADQAYSAFHKSVWNAAWQSPGYYALAAISTERGHLPLALDELRMSLDADNRNMQARALKAAVLYRLHRNAEAEALIEDSLRMDPLNLLLLAVRALGSASSLNFDRYRTALGADAQSHLDLVCDLAWSGLQTEAIHLLLALQHAVELQTPMTWYLLSWLDRTQGDVQAAESAAARAEAACGTHCFPARLEEMIALEAILRHTPDAPAANLYLGNLYYDKRRYQEAITCWRSASAHPKAVATVFRNLAIAEQNILHRPADADALYAEAFRRNPADARVFFEWDQLKKRARLSSAHSRLQSLAAYPHLVDARDDLSLERITLLNQLGRWTEALDHLHARRFSPWEGGEGLLPAQYVHAHRSLGLEAIADGDTQRARSHFQQARSYPENLGEGKHLLTEERDLDYYAGYSAALLGNLEEARDLWQAASRPLRASASPSFAYSTLFRALALMRLDDRAAARSALAQIEAYANHFDATPPRIDYFATSLPNLLLFDDDLDMRHRVECVWLRALLALGQGQLAEAQAQLRAVLQDDPDHLLALDTLHRLAHQSCFRALVVPA